MPRGEKTRSGKQNLIREICKQINLPVQEKWLSDGGTVTGRAFEGILCKIAERTGIPPEHFEEHQKYIFLLIHKSMECMILALEIINKPLIGYRLEVFLLLFINSWELLLKAKIIKESNNIDDIFEDKVNNKTKTVTNMIKKVFSSEKDPVRINLLRLDEIRNKAAHLFITNIPPEILYISQAGIFNYNRFLKEWFNRSLSDNLPYGMMFLISDFNNIFSDSLLLNKQLSSDSLSYLKDLHVLIKNDIYSLPENQIPSYILQIDLNFAFVKHESKADLIAHLETGEYPNPLIIYKTQEIINKYPYSHRELVKIIKEKRPEVKDKQINDIIKRYKIKSNQEYSTYSFCKQEKKKEFERTGKLHSCIPSIYNSKAITFILEKLSSDNK